MESIPWADLDAQSPGGALLRRAWQPVARCMDLPVGATRRVRVLGEDLTLFRGESKGVYAVGARCPHRGTDLLLGRVQGDTLSCLHHGWCWRGRGEAAPAHPGQPAGLKLRSLPTREALGLVFVWLGEGPPPALPSFPSGPWTALTTDRWPCSFFRRLENTLDLSHLPHSHRLSGVGGIVPPEMRIEVRPLSGGLEVGSPELPAPPVRFYLPNLLQFSSPGPGGAWVDHLVWRVPEDQDSCRSFGVLNASVPTSPRTAPWDASEGERLAEQVLAGQSTLEELAGASSLTEIEDYLVLVGQGPLRGQSEEHLGPQDGPVRALRSLWSEALGWPALPPPVLERLPC